MSSRFSPRLLDPEILARLTVGRAELLERLVENLSAAILSGHGRFDLLVGPRGVGKSHMLGLIEARVRAHPQLGERLVLVTLPEEFHASSLLHLLARVLDGLPESDAMPPVEAQLRLLRGRDTSEAIDMAVAMIRARLQGRALLLMFENLDEIFAALGRKGQAQLRKIVQTEAGWSIFATARTSLALTRQSEPFHGTFVVEQLKALAPVQCCEMLLRLAEVHERPELVDWL
ncbi:MAG: ATP-binding protein, partial [Myxococcales bacterium]|nr:ATP-binding protein [Myxococcales bacterium]